MNSNKNNFTQEEWYTSLSDEGKYVVDLIFKYHNYFRRKDKRHKNFVIFTKIIVLFLAMCNTIVLGTKYFSASDFNISLGLILSAVITFLTAMSTFFNFEQYWMRNILMHIELNKLRDKFIYEAKAKKISGECLDFYINKLGDIQDENIKYWENSMLKLK